MVNQVKTCSTSEEPLCGTYLAAFVYSSNESHGASSWELIIKILQCNRPTEVRLNWGWIASLCIGTVFAAKQVSSSQASCTSGSASAL